MENVNVPLPERIETVNIRLQEWRYRPATIWDERHQSRMTFLLQYSADTNSRLNFLIENAHAARAGGVSRRPVS